MGENSPYQPLFNPPLKKRKETSEQNFTYEHFPVVCPTCKGNGRIVQEEEGLVTFVPVKDERLRPAWTKLKIGSLLAFIIILGGLCTFFLYPRSVSIKVLTAPPLNMKWEFDTENPWILYKIPLQITNNNFFPVSLNGTRIHISYQQDLVSITEDNKPLKVTGKRTSIVPYLINVTYGTVGGTQLNKYIKKQCQNRRLTVTQSIAVTSHLSYWLHDEHIESPDNFFHTYCEKMFFPLTTPTGSTVPSTTHAPTYPPFTLHPPHHITTTAKPPFTMKTLPPTGRPAKL